MSKLNDDNDYEDIMKNDLVYSELNNKNKNKDE